MTVTAGKTTIDPDKLLAHQRRAIEEWEQARVGSASEQEAAERATAAASTLDDWLAHGGALPTEWLAALAAAGSDLTEVTHTYQQMVTAEGKHHALTFEDLHRAFRLAWRALAQKNAEVARLNAELDGYRGNKVFLAMEAHCVAIVAGTGALAHPCDVTEGSILRATDTGREWVRRDGKWEDRNGI